MGLPEYDHVVNTFPSDCADQSFRESVLIASCDRHRARFETIMSCELEQGGIKANGIALAFEHHALKIIVENGSRHPTPGRESLT